jgi:serine/threonine-protein kinase HipA
VTGRLNIALDFGAGTGPVAVGQMGWDSMRREAAAEWDPAFAARPLPISPLLVKTHAGLLRPRGRAFDGLPGVFGDSLPDGWGRLLIDRELQSRGRSLADITPLDRLAMVGLDGMGALTYRPEEVPEPVAEIDLDWFAGLVPQVEEGASTSELERLRAVAGGSQGARPKFVAQLSPDGDRLRSHRLPLAPGWRHVMIKRRAERDPDGAVEAEAAYARMAKDAGIDMAWTGVLRSDRGEPFFVTDRFDRVGAGRLHMQTVAALLEVDFREATLDYSELLRVVRHVTRDIRATEEMYRRMIFNARALNRDDHLKNHAFLMHGSGAWRLAPAYDLSFSQGPGGEHTLTIGDEGRRPGTSAFAEVAKDAGIRPRRATEIIAQVDGAIARWHDHAQAEHVPPALRARISDAMAEAKRWP